MTSLHLQLGHHNHHGSFNRSLSSGLFRFPLTWRLNPPSARYFFFSISASSPSRSASSRINQPRVGGRTRRRSSGSKPDVSPFAKRSASQFVSLGAHLTSGRAPEHLSCSPNSIRSAESGNLLDISLFRSAPFPLLSVYDGITTRRVLRAGSARGKKERTARRSQSLKRGYDPRRFALPFKHPRKVLRTDFF